MPLLTPVFFVLGLAALVVGSELLVRGGARLAVLMGVTPLVVGLTVVAYGTSAPELAVTLGAVADGRADLSLGNVVGSNIMNILLGLGLAATLCPVRVERRLIRRDLPLMVAASSLVWLMALDGRIGWLDGLALLTGAIAYTVSSLRSRSARSDAPSPSREHKARWPLHVALIVAGLAALVLGSRWVVQSATLFAQAFGVSELVIGLTIVAVGTSLPEIATFLTATRRGHQALGIGNIIGSNLFNLLLVLGCAGVLARGGLTVSPHALAFDLPVMVLIAWMCVPIFFVGMRISRAEGVLFVGGYALYTSDLLLEARGAACYDAFRAVVGWGVLPLILATLSILFGRDLARRLRARKTRGHSGGEDAENG